MTTVLGVDDTDSLRGMCTTFLATELVRALSPWDLVGYPRLVRLNPNVPWKTRGNGAVCLRVGRGRGARFPVGRIDGRTAWAHPRADGGPAPDDLIDVVAGVVEAWSAFDDPNTNPGFVLLERPPRPGLYWRTVREIVTKEEALAAIDGLGLRREYKNGRGVIGASAAAAWRPRDRTYEVLAYRERARWGTPRVIDPESVRAMDAAFPSTFNSYDAENDRVVIAPRTPCPVLCGIRGDDPGVLPAALASLRSERPDRWLLFETNQGTDDHVVVDPPEARPRTSISIAGEVAAPPRTFPGGHVVFPLRWREPLDVVAYEPSKQFRRVVRALVPGDRVRVVGSVRDVPRSLNLEKIELVSKAVVVAPAGNPWCPACSKRMKSSGARGPYRCRRCGSRRPRSEVEWRPRPRGIAPGWYEPPAGSRRHLSRPLKRAGPWGKEAVAGRTPLMGLPQHSRGADSPPATAVTRTVTV